MDLSFKEKSIAGSLAITVGLFAYYFNKVFQVITSDSSTLLHDLPGTLLGVVIAMVVIEIAYHGLIAIGPGAGDRDDERDRLIEAKAMRIAYFVLGAGCVMTIGHATLIGVFSERVGDAVMANPIMTANFVLASFIIAEITGFGMQLLYYRRGV